MRTHVRLSVSIPRTILLIAALGLASVTGRAAQPPTGAAAPGGAAPAATRVAVFEGFLRPT